MKKRSQMIILIISVLFTFVLLTPVIAIEDNDDHTELFHAPDVINGSILSVKDCVALAFKNSPNIKRKKYELDIAKSNVGIAKSRYFPVIGASTGFNYERNSDSIYYDKKYRDLPYIGIRINQLVYDFGKTTANINMEKFYQIGAEYEFIDALCHTLFHIKERYYNLLQKTALFELAKKNIELNNELIKISKRNPDLLTAKVNLSEAEIQLNQAQKELQNAKFDLSNAMYLDNHINYLINNTPTFDYSIHKNPDVNDFHPIVFPFKINEAPEIAYKNSPDLQVIISTKNAMEQNLKYIKKSFLPSLTGGVEYDLNNTYDTTNNSLQAGIGLSVETNLKELKHSIDAAKSEVNIADNEIILFKKDLYYEIQRALNNTERTQEQFPIIIKEISQTQINLENIIDGYKTEKYDYTALQDARKDYINAQARYIYNLYEYNMAIIQTEMALHYHIVDIHHSNDHTLHNHIEELINHYNEAISLDKNNSKTKNHNKIQKL